MVCIPVLIASLHLSTLMTIILRIPKQLPGKGFRVSNTADIPAVLRSILSTMVDR